MREKIKDKGRLEHILSSIDIILNNKNRYEYEDVINDPIVFYGFVKHVEIIGEAVYMLTKDYNYIQYDQREQTTMYGFYNFRTECMRNVPPIYINTVIKLLPVYEALNELEIHDQKKIDNVIMDFILKNKKVIKNVLFFKK